MERQLELQGLTDEVCNSRPWVKRDRKANDLLYHATTEADA
jgi:hypothetical protein